MKRSWIKKVQNYLLLGPLSGIRLNRVGLVGESHDRGAVVEEGGVLDILSRHIHVGETDVMHHAVPAPRGVSKILHK
jgi:hypothetical protein